MLLCLSYRCYCYHNAVIQKIIINLNIRLLTFNFYVKIGDAYLKLFMYFYFLKMEIDSHRMLCNI